MRVRKGGLSDTKRTSNTEPATRRRRIAIGVTVGLLAPIMALQSACSSGSEGSQTKCEGQLPTDGGVPLADSGHKSPHPSTHDSGAHPGNTHDSGAQPEAGAHHDSGVAATFRPSNLPSGAIELGDGAAAGDVVINDDCNLDTSSGDLACSGTIDTFTYAFKMVDQPGGGQVGLFIVKSLRVAQTGQLRVMGGSPVIIYALETMNIDGNVTDISSWQPAGGFVQDSSGHGGGPGGGEALLDYNAAGGGSYCGVGGKGGPGGGGPARAGGKAYGNPEIVPLLGGSSGGGGSDGNGGSGGAALQLSAGRSITVSIGGVISVGGLGGAANGGAGGSGGALVLEAPTVTVRGTLAANGGGGALFNGGSRGQSGQPSGTAALGSAPTAGVGSAGKTANGGDGTVSNGSVNSAGGGGGGAGRIRINTTSGAADLTGATISPDTTTSCATQGKLK